MPNRWPITSGNWSNAAIWSGSIIPTASDDVFANNQTVTIDQDITVTSLRNSSGTGITQGGRFVLLNNNIISASTIAGTSNSCLIYTGSSGGTINSTINQSGANFISSLELSGTGGVISISGSLPCTVNANQWNIGITTANQIINFTGSITATSPDNRNRVFSIGAGPNTYNILSNITCSGANVFACGGNIVNINITGSTLTTGATYIINNPGATSTINITGSIAGPFLATSALHTTNIRGPISSNSTTTCISDSSAGSISISGSVIATLSPVITCTGAGRLNISGSIYAGISAPAISSTSATATNVFIGPFYNTNNRNAVYAVNLQLLSGSTTSWTFDTETNLEQRTLYTADFPGNFPSASNVRQGTVFGNTGQFTGTVAIPVASNVLKGVLLDNTTGSASFTTQNVWSVLTSSLNVTESIGERLQNVSTVATDGILITSKGTL